MSVSFNISSAFSVDSSVLSVVSAVSVDSIFSSVVSSADSVVLLSTFSVLSFSVGSACVD